MPLAGVRLTKKSTHNNFTCISIQAQPYNPHRAMNSVYFMLVSN